VRDLIEGIFIRVISIGLLFSVLISLNVFYQLFIKEKLTKEKNHGNKSTNLGDC